MPNKKINALDVKVAVSTDLMLVGDPSTGTAYKSTLATLPLVPTSRTITINGVAFDLSANRAWTLGTVTSVGLSMPNAFGVANSPVTSSGTLAVTALGTASQYIRGDGELATFPSTSSGGSSVNYYLNGSVNSSVAGYKQLGNTATIGGGTDFTLVGNGLIAQFLTDVGNPNRLEIPGGAWNFEMYFQVSSSGGNQKFYVELLKYDGTTFTSIASSSAIPEEITGGTAIDLYLTSLAVPTTSLLVTDRLAIRIYIVDNSGGRTVTLHTEDNTLCEIITTFAGGISALNGLTANTQYFATGTSGTDFGISSLSDTHTFNLPTASATNRGALSSADWSTFNGKVSGSGVANQLTYWNGTGSVTGSTALTYVDSTGLITLDKNQTTGTAITVRNANTGANAGTFYVLDNGGTNVAQLVKRPSSFAGFSIQQANDLVLVNSGLGDIGLFANVLAGKIKFAAGGASTAQMTLTSAGRLLLGTVSESTYLLDVNGTARVNNNMVVASASTVFSGLTVGGASGQNHITIDSTQNSELRFSTNGSTRSFFRQFENNELRFYTAGGTILSNWNVFNNNFVFSNISIVGGADASSVMEIRSSNRGFLPPRMTATQRDAIASPATGLSIYNTTTNTNDIYNGTAWSALASGNIYTANGTLTGDRTLTSGGFGLTILGGKEEISGFPSEQISLRLQGSSTTKNPYLSLKNTNASGKDYSLRSMVDGTFDIFNITNLNSVFKYDHGNNLTSLRQATTLTDNLNFNLGFNAGVSGLWLSNSKTIGTYAIIQSGGSTFLNAPTGGSIYFRINNADRALLTSAGRLLLGTTTESTFLLDVNGTARVSAATSGTNYSLTVTDSNTSIGTTLYLPYSTVNLLLQVTGSGSRITGTNGKTYLGFKYSTGNVIVGDTEQFSVAPDKLNIAANSTTQDGQGISIIDSGGSGNVGVGLNFIANSGISTMASIRTKIQSGFNNSVLSFNTNNASNVLTERYRITETGNLLVGDTTNIPSAILAATSTTKGFLPPRMTSTQRDAIATPATGLQVYNTTGNTLDYYNGTTWSALASGNIYTANGTLTGDRTLTSGGFGLTILGGKETFTGYQRALWLKTSTAAKDSVELVLENTFTSTGRIYEIGSQSDGSFNIVDRTASNLRLKILGTYFQFHSSTAANANLLGQVASINALWFNQTASTASTANYTLCNAGGLTLLNAPTGGAIYFRVGNVDKALLTSAGRLLLGTTTESTFIFDAVGTARISGKGWFGNGSSYIFASFQSVVSTSSSSSAYFEVAGAASNSSAMLFTKGGDLASMWNLGTQENNNFYLFRHGINKNLLVVYESTKNFGISSDGVNSDIASAQLFVNSTTKGFLPPRMTTTQKNAIASPASGLIVYDNTTNVPNYYNGTAWVDYGLNIYNSNGTLSGNRTVTMSGNSINFSGGNIGIGGAPNAINSLEVSAPNQWSGAFIGNMGGARTPSVPYGIHLGWNYTGGSGESNILWGTGNGTTPYLTFSSWDGTSKVDRMVMSDIGKLTLPAYLTSTSFTGTPVGHLAFDLSGNVITVPVPSSINIYNSNGTLTGDRTISTTTGFKLTLNPKLEVVTTTYNVTAGMLGWSAVNGYVQTTIPASTSFTAAGYAFSSLIGNNYMTYQGSATFAADTFIGSIVGINNIAFTAASSTITITQSSSIRTYSAGLYQNTISGSVDGTITHLSGLAVRPLFRASGTSTMTVTNNYGLLIADQNEYNHATITNRWGIYQEGANDNNYFRGKVILGTSNTVGASVLNINGLPTSSSGLSTGDIWNDGGILKIA